MAPAFSLLSIALALGVGFRHRAAAVTAAAALFLAYHLLNRAAESMMLEGTLAAPLAALLPAATVFAAFLAIVLKARLGSQSSTTLSPGLNSGRR